MSEHAVQEYREAKQPMARAKGRRDRGLLLIGVFKLAKAVFFFLLGIGALHLLHKNLGDEAMRMATSLRLDPEGRLVALLTTKVDLVDIKHLREIGAFTFAYAGVALVEGVGLLMEKIWAEYLTLSLTVVFLPWELFELIREATLFRVGLLLINLIVLAYLLWLLRRTKKALSLDH